MRVEVIDGDGNSDGGKGEREEFVIWERRKRTGEWDGMG